MTMTKLLIRTALLAVVLVPVFSRSETKSVEVLGAGERVLEAKAGDEELRLLTPPKKHWLIRGLAEGDEVTVSYEQDGEKNILTDVQGSGSLVGTVVKIEKVHITVEAENGVHHRLMPRWRGCMPRDGGGHEPAVLEQIHSVEKGQRVRLSWVIEEGKRVTKVTSL